MSGQKYTGVQSSAPPSQGMPLKLLMFHHLPYRMGLKFQLLKTVVKIHDDPVSEGISTWPGTEPTSCVTWAGYLSSLHLSSLVAKMEPTVLLLQQNRPSQNSVALNDSHCCSRSCGLPGAHMILAEFGWGDCFLLQACESAGWLCPCVSHPLGSVGQAGPADLVELAGVQEGSKNTWSL